jgi:hypothetical protein
MANALWMYYMTKIIDLIDTVIFKSETKKILSTPNFSAVDCVCSEKKIQANNFLAHLPSFQHGY